METTMPMTASIVGNDPLARFLRDRAAGKHPIPLNATRIDVTIRGGLAIVTTERTFRNLEKQSIEATMTFPVPVDATLCSLTARIDGRTLQAVAQARAQARTTYEDAIDRGKAAVLHEELLKGIHMLSVAHVAPDAEIVVVDTWTAPLSFVEAAPQLRIPTTVGEIYGRSPFSPGDDLVTGDAVHEATVSVACEDGTATLLRAGAPTGGGYRVTLDRPIDIAVAGWRKRTLAGVAADGRQVTLEIEPSPKVDAGLDLDLLFDHSGSMSEHAAGDREIAASKFEVARDALAAVARDRLTGADRIRLWQFNDTVDFVGAASGKKCNALVARLSETGGGTEIGRAFDAVIAQGRSKDVLIVTDGKSWAFDPQKVSRAGLRVTAVLIGEDALEAGIAHLAGMTGGQAFIAAGSDAGAAITAALEAARVPHQPLAPIADAPSRIEVLRRGARLVASWGEQTQGQATADGRLIGATAAMLAIPGMADAAAGKLAEAEGIVCHLTSLVLVDEVGVRHEGIPASRKVELMAPLAAAMPVGAARVAAACCYEPEVDARARSSGMVFKSLGGPSGRGGLMQRLSGFLSDSLAAPPSSGTSMAKTQPASPPALDLGDLVGLIDWDADPEALRRGDLSDLPTSVVMAIQSAARLPEIVALARTIGIDPVVAVIALLARAAGRSNRSAQRLSRALLGGAQGADLEAAMHEVGL
jgi:hypothetical protein